jgi:hypothetical protein
VLCWSSRNGALPRYGFSEYLVRCWGVESFTSQSDAARADVLLQSASRVLPNQLADDYCGLDAAVGRALARADWRRRGQEFQHREAGGGFEPYLLLELRSPWESVFTEVAAVPGIHISLSDSKTLKDAKSLMAASMMSPYQN